MYQVPSTSQIGAVVPSSFFLGVCGVVGKKTSSINSSSPCHSPGALTSLIFIFVIVKVANISNLPTQCVPSYLPIDKLFKIIYHSHMPLPE